MLSYLTSEVRGTVSVALTDDARKQGNEAEYLLLIVYMSWIVSKKNFAYALCQSKDCFVARSGGGGGANFSFVKYIIYSSFSGAAAAGVATSCSSILGVDETMRE